jgi:hypothetical protein
MRAKLLLHTLLLAAVPAAAAGGLLAIPGTGGDLTLRSGDGPARVVASGAATAPGAGGAAEKALALGDGASLRQVAGDRARWWAVGTREEGEGSKLVLLHGGESTPTGAEAPASGAARVFSPALLVAGGDLRALAWLEGERHGRYAVRFARRDGGRWAPSETVAPPPAVGSRVSLSAAVLADGSSLLAWSAYDGRDDEIWWTRHGGEGWSAPRRVGFDDQVPDITPTLAAVGDGALLAWSEFDGRDYRLLLARFDGEDFRPAGRLGGRGATFPRFDGEGGGETARLLYRDVESGGWTLAALDPRGRLLRQASVAGAGSEPPAVAADGEAVTFKWLADGVVRSAHAAWRR